MASPTQSARVPAQSQPSQTGWIAGPTPAAVSPPTIATLPTSPETAGSFETIATRIDGIRWTGRPEFMRLLADLPSSAWTDPASQHGWVCVKRNPQRTVWRARIDGKRYYVKLYRARPVRDWLKHVGRRPSCRCEFECGRFAAEHGVAASRPVAYAEGIRQADARYSVLVLDAIEPAEPLDEFWQRECTDRASQATRQALIESLAELIARAHQAGFEHTDMHAANILVQQPRGGGVRSHFVDLHAALLDRPVSDAAIVRNLVQLNQWFRRHSSVKDRIRFLRAYLRWRNEFETEFSHARPVETDFGGLMRLLATTAERHARRLWAQRDRRARRSGKYFARLRLGRGWRAIVLRASKRPNATTGAQPRELSAGWWRTQLSDPRRLLRLGTGAVRKRSHSAWVGQTALDHETGPVDLILKRPRARNWRRRLSQLLPPSRCARGWRTGHALLNRDIVAARPLAVLERRLGPFVLDSLLLTELVPDAIDLASYLRRRHAERSSRGWRRDKQEMIQLLARQMRQLSERGFVHRDCKADNLLVLGASPPRLCWVDMDGIRLLARPAIDAEAYGGLARLWVSLGDVPGINRTDAVRFLRALHARFGGNPLGWRESWHAIAGLVDHKLERQQARVDWKLRKYGRP